MKVTHLQAKTQVRETIYTVELFNNFPGGEEEGVVFGNRVTSVFHRSLTTGELVIVDQMEPQGEDENPLVFAARAHRVGNDYNTNVLGVVYDLRYTCSDDGQYVKVVGKIKPDSRLKSHWIQYLQLRCIAQSLPEKRLLKVICVELPAKYKEVV